MPKYIIVLALSICAVSTAAPLAKLSSLHPIGLGFWRTFIVGALLLPFAKSLPKKHRAITLFSGLLLALHFWSWFESLQHTSALRSTLLVCLNPIWVALYEQIFSKQKPSLKYWFGVSISIVGVCLMSTTSENPTSLLGDALALLGGFFGAMYLLIGRKVRKDVDISTYGAINCLSCAFWLLLIGLGLSFPILESTWSGWLIIIAMSLGPQLTGHIGLNYALKFTKASRVSMLLLLEPVGAALIAASVLSEIPTQQELLGALIVIFGLLLGIRNQKN